MIDRPRFIGTGMPPIGCVCMFLPNDTDVKIVAHTFVAGRPAAVWQHYDEFGYGREVDFGIDPDQEGP